MHEHYGACETQRCRESQEGGFGKRGLGFWNPVASQRFLVNPPRLANRSGNLFSATPIALYSLALDILETIGPSPRDAKHLLLHCSLEVGLHCPLPCEPFPRPPTRTVSTISRHSPSCRVEHVRSPRQVAASRAPLRIASVSERRDTSHSEP